jgi:predicted aldo/keto reductase-like oxidoreductase
VGVDIAMVNKLCDLATAHPEIPATVREHYAALDTPASACLSCGKCETRCPFHVKVTERMKYAAALFEENI